MDTLLTSLPESKFSKILTTCGEKICHRRHSRRQLEYLVGLLSFASYYNPLDRLRQRPIISRMNTTTIVVTSDALVPLDSVVRCHFQRWTDESFLRTPIPMSSDTLSPTHDQRFRVGDRAFLTSTSGLLRLTLFRPHNGDSLHTSQGDLAFVSSHEPLNANTRVLGSPHLSHSELPQQISECLGGSELSPEPDLHRVGLRLEDVWLACSLTSPPQVDLFATRDNHLLPCVTPCPDL